MSKRTEDLIRNPSWYAQFKIQPADYSMDNNLPHHVGSIIKYVTRAGHKLYPDCNALESERIDLEKAMDWAAKRIKKIDDALAGDKEKEISDAFLGSLEERLLNDKKKFAVAQDILANRIQQTTDEINNKLNYPEGYDGGFYDPKK